MRAVRLLVIALSLAGVLGAQKIPVSGVTAIGMTVSDADRSIDFYSRVLHFTKISDQEFAGEALERSKGVFGARVRVVRMRLGSEELELTQYLAPEGEAFPAGTRGNDRWFQHVAIIVRNMDEAYALLRKFNVGHASSGPQTLPEWNKNAAGIKAFYFRDPDGHFLELLEFPPDKGDPRWHRGQDPFLGIDHTAITVTDTDASVAFYRELGFVVAGASENYGTEQEHLNNVFGAHLRITALRAPQGPKIELLEYLAPRDGRAYPPQARDNDLLHWETIVSVPDADRAFTAAKSGHFTLVSSRPASYSAERTEFQLKDPDGHVLAVTASAATAER